MEEALKTEKAKPGHKKTKLGWIPEDWEERSLSEIGTFLKGKGVPKKYISEDGLPCLTYGELYKHHHDVIKDFVSFIPKEIAADSQKLHYGDILFAGSGETLEEIGKSAAFIGEFPAFAGGDIIILRQSSCDPVFLGYLLNQDGARRQLNRLGQGHSIVHIYSSGLGTLIIPLPPLPEQRAIARILSTWDKAIQTLQKLIDKKEERKKGLMQVLLSGEVRLEGYDDPWVKKDIESLGRVIRGASPRPKGDPRYYGGQVPRLMVEDVTRDGKYVTPSTDFLTQEGAKKSRPCKAGTLTIVCSGDVGTPSFLAVDACIHDGFLAITDLKEDIDDDFLFYQMLQLKERLERSATHGGVFTNLTTTILKQFILSVPSFEEQEEIAIVLKAADQEIEKLKNQLTKLEKQKKGLMQKLLTGEVRVKNLNA